MEVEPPRRRVPRWARGAIAVAAGLLLLTIVVGVIGGGSPGAGSVPMPGFPKTVITGPTPAPGFALTVKSAPAPARATGGSRAPGPEKRCRHRVAPKVTTHPTKANSC